MFEFSAPWIFLLLPLPWLVYKIIPSAKKKKQAALRVPFFDYIKSLHIHNQRVKLLGFGKAWLIVTIWVLLIIALAGPQWAGEKQAIARSGRDLLLAVDLSGSMQIPDMQLHNKPVNRLQAIKSVAADFISGRKGDRIGLILFGSKAYLQTPLTFDTTTIKHMLNDASIGLAGQQTAIGDAIGLGIKRLSQYPAKSRVLVLLTDGANNSGTASPIAAAKLAAENHVKIYTIGFGADKLTVNSVFGRQTLNPSADLDTDTLEQIAKITGGQFFRAKDTTGLMKVYQDINKLEPVAGDKNFFRPIKPLYPWPLAMAFLFSIGLALSQLPFKFKYKYKFKTKIKSLQFGRVKQ